MTRLDAFDVHHAPHLPVSGGGPLGPLPEAARTDSIAISPEAAAPDQGRPVHGLDAMLGWLSPQAGPQARKADRGLNEARLLASGGKSAVTSLADLGEQQSQRLPTPAATAASSVKAANLGKADAVLGPASVLANGASTVSAIRKGDVPGAVSSGGFTLSAAGATARVAGALPAALDGAPGVVGGAASVVGGGAKLIDGVRHGDAGTAAEGGTQAALGGAAIAGTLTGNVPLAAGASVGYLGLVAWEHRGSIGHAAEKVGGAVEHAVGHAAGAVTHFVGSIF